MKKLIPLLVTLAAACTSTTQLSTGNLAGPISLALAPSTTQQGGSVLFIGESDGEDVRAFLPGPRVFVRGPNGISPLSISLEIVNDAGAVIAPSFRPSRMVGGSTQGQGFAVVAGAVNRVAVVDAQTLKVTRAVSDVLPCPMGALTPSCLPSQPLDVAVAKSSVTSNDFDTVFVLLAAGPTSGQQIVRFTATVESQNGSNVPVLTGGTAIPFDATVGQGRFLGFDVLTDGTTAFLADSANPRVVTLPLAGGAATSLATTIPSADVFPTPRYVGLDGFVHEEGEELLVILTDGSLEIVQRGGAPGQPVAAPINLGSAIQDLAFASCPTTDPASPCRTPLQLPSGDTRNLSLVAFAALANGTTVPLTPDVVSVNPATQTTPTIFRQIDTNGAGPGVSPASPVLVVPDNATRPNVVPTLTVTPGLEGVTRDETYTLTFQGALPALSNRGATVSGTLATPTLTDPGRFASQVEVGDTVKLTPVGTDCPELSNAVYVVTTVTPPDAIVLGNPTPAVTCATVPSRVSYTVSANGAHPWVLTGSSSGFILRFASTLTDEPVPGVPFYFPTATIPSPTDAILFKLTLVTLTPLPPPGSTFTFTTSSGVTPFLVVNPDASANAAGAGFANAVVATADTVFIAATGGNAVTVGVLNALRSSSGVIDYR